MLTQLTCMQLINTYQFEIDSIAEFYYKLLFTHCLINEPSCFSVANMIFIFLSQYIFISYIVFHEGISCTLEFGFSAFFLNCTHPQPNMVIHFSVHRQRTSSLKPS